MLENKQQYIAPLTGTPNVTPQGNTTFPFARRIAELSNVELEETAEA